MSEPRTNASSPPAALDAIAPTSSLESVYQRDLGRLVELAEWIVGSRSIAEELVHDTFARAVARPPKLQDPQGLAAYMRSGVVNACRSKLRRFAIERKHQPSSPETYEQPPRPDEDIRRSLNKLSLRQRQVVVLRFYEDLTIDQIAADLNISAGSVKTHLHRALKGLGALLDERNLS